MDKEMNMTTGPVAQQHCSQRNGGKNGCAPDRDKSMSMPLTDSAPGTAPDPAQVFAALWTAHHPSVLAYCRRRAPAEMAADAATATFAVLWRRIADAPADPLPWLYGVARRELANRRRAQSRFGAFLARLSNDRIVTGAEVAADASSQAMDRLSARAALARPPAR